MKGFTALPILVRCKILVNAWHLKVRSRKPHQSQPKCRFLNLACQRSLFIVSRPAKDSFHLLSLPPPLSASSLDDTICGLSHVAHYLTISDCYTLWGETEAVLPRGGTAGDPPQTSTRRRNASLPVIPVRPRTRCGRFVWTYCGRWLHCCETGRKRKEEDRRSCGCGDGMTNSKSAARRRRR
jgi:hypothetical protein